MLLEGDLLSVYSRVFADTGKRGDDAGEKSDVRHRSALEAAARSDLFPRRRTAVAAERAKWRIRYHAARQRLILNGGKYSDEWHPNGSGWFAQNLYLDAAQYVRQDIQAWTADYRVSWHQKVANGQTIEPYAHVQDNGYRDKGTQGAQLGGVGVRWNIWTGETHYDAWPHKVSLGVEYQHTFKAINQRNGERNNAFLTIGVHW